MEIDKNTIRRRGQYIQIADGLTATEDWDGNLPTLSIRRDGKQVKFWRGSSLYFNTPLTAEDKDFLVALATD